MHLSSDGCIPREQFVIDDTLFVAPDTHRFPFCYGYAILFYYR